MTHSLSLRGVDQSLTGMIAQILLLKVLALDHESYLMTFHEHGLFEPKGLAQEIGPLDQAKNTIFYRLTIDSSNTILHCQNWEETVHIYQKLLNHPVITSTDWFIAFELTNDSRLSIADESRTTIKSNKGKGVTLAFEVDDLTSARTHIKKMGLKYLEKTSASWNARMIHIFDPEGN